MECKKCKKQIENDSVFCSFCGTNSNDNGKNIKLFGFNIPKLYLGIYLIWVLIHLILLLTHQEEITYDFEYESFWPFSEGTNLNFYDYSEFLLYTIAPIILYMIFNLLKNNLKKES